MRQFPRLVTAAVIPLVVTAIPVELAGAEPTGPSYEREIAPILRTYCLGCHDDATQEGGLSVERYATLRKGGETVGDPVRPGDADASTLLARLTSGGSDHMPPHDQPQPQAADVSLVHEWIAAGAGGPEEDRSLAESFRVPSLPGYSGTLAVSAMARSPDGSLRVVARGRTISITDATGSKVRSFEAPEGAQHAAARVAAVHFSSDGRLLVVAGGTPGHSGVAELRDVTTGTLIARFGGHRDMLLDAELSPDGRLLATAGYDRSVKLWNVADGSLDQSMDGHTGAVNDLAWHPSGKVLASASADETVKLWRITDGLRLDTLSQPQGEVLAVGFVPDGSRVLAAGGDRRVHVWKVVSLDAPGTNPPLEARFAHESPIVAMAIAADGQTLFTAGKDGSLRAWTLPLVTHTADLPRQPDVPSVLVGTAGGVLVARMDGSVDQVDFVAAAAPTATTTAAVTTTAAPTPPASVPPMPDVRIAEREPDDAAT
ncbi:MAG: WD40 repeat domain-containing protein, partial [Planctomycetaceae bacterium]